MVPPRLRNRVLDSDDDDSAMARSDEDQTQNRSTVINDSENDADVDAEVREVTRSTRMLMVAVEGEQRIYCRYWLTWVLTKLFRSSNSEAGENQ